MKQLATVIGFTVLCLGLSAWAAEQVVSFSGTWILDTKESDAFLHPLRDLGAPGMMGGGMGGGMPGGGMGGPQPSDQKVPLVIEQTGNDIRITRTTNVNGKETPVIENHKCDGSERVEMMPAPNMPDPVKLITTATLKKQISGQNEIDSPQGKK